MGGGFGGWGVGGVVTKDFHMLLYLFDDSRIHFQINYK